jgi:hypothetical protein
MIFMSAKQICLANSNLKLVANLIAPDATSIIENVLLDKPTTQEHLTISSA